MTYWTYSANKIIRLLIADEDWWRLLAADDLTRLCAALKGTEFEKMEEWALRSIAQHACVRSHHNGLWRLRGPRVPAITGAGCPAKPIV
jgi:hypothetical protein